MHVPYECMFQQLCDPSPLHMALPRQDSWLKTQGLSLVIKTEKTCHRRMLCPELLAGPGPESEFGLMSKPSHCLATVSLGATPLSLAFYLEDALSVITRCLCNTGICNKDSTQSFALLSLSFKSESPVSEPDYQRWGCGARSQMPNKAGEMNRQSSSPSKKMGPKRLENL